MPSEKVLKEKQRLVEELSQRLQGSVAGVLVDYRGINVADDTKLRKELRESGVEYSVVKNNLLRLALPKAGLDGLENVLEGTTALATSEKDPVAAAKVLCKFAEGKKDFFNVKAGFVEGGVLDSKRVEALAKLPSREELIAKTLGSLNAPIYGLVTVLNGNIRGLAVVLNAIAEKKGA